jgi:hypothetical protein
VDDPIKKPFPHNILRTDSMTWNYRVIKKHSKLLNENNECIVDEDYYYMAEVYYDKNKKPISQSDAIEITGSSKEDVIEILKTMLEDATTKEILEELGND